MTVTEKRIGGCAPQTFKELKQINNRSNLCKKCEGFTSDRNYLQNGGVEQ